LQHRFSLIALDHADGCNSKLRDVLRTHGVREFKWHELNGAKRREGENGGDREPRRSAQPAQLDAKIIAKIMANRATPVLSRFCHGGRS
jgi:hypothetical protein